MSDIPWRNTLNPKDKFHPDKIVKYTILLENAKGGDVGRKSLFNVISTPAFQSIQMILPFSEEDKFPFKI